MPKRKEKPNNSLLSFIKIINDNKFFAGIIMLTMNIGSKYISIELSKTQESYIKYSLGRQLLVFTVLWMGTRDIVTSLIMTVIFILFADYLFNEHSKYCIIPEKYKELNITLDTSHNKVTQKEVNDAIDVLKRARIHKKDKPDDDLENKLYKENFI
uniref:Uncharacterized protein n=1 Tax=viral metagenome TaxID=1070528 RepID=A0A6C0JJ74_9ZZZZ